MARCPFHAVIGNNVLAVAINHGTFDKRKQAIKLSFT
jgi:hypothetical protein